MYAVASVVSSRDLSMWQSSVRPVLVQELVVKVHHHSVRSWISKSFEGRQRVLLLLPLMFPTEKPFTTTENENSPSRCKVFITPRKRKKIGANAVQWREKNGWFQINSPCNFLVLFVTHRQRRARKKRAVTIPFKCFYMTQTPNRLQG